MIAIVKLKPLRSTFVLFNFKPTWVKLISGRRRRLLGPKVKHL